MAKLTTQARNALPSSDFAVPSSRSYPVHDSNHAKAALSDVAKFGTAAEKALVHSAVKKRFPKIHQEYMDDTGK